LSLVVPELRKRGYDVEVLSWEDPDVDWKNRKIVFFGSFWGYPKKQEALNKWLSHIKSLNITFINSMKFFEWNIKKTYLAELQDAKIPVIPTMLVLENSTDSLEDTLLKAQDQFKTTD